MKLPSYKSDKLNYFKIDTVNDLVNRIISSGVDLIAVDTETYYDDELARVGAITKWINGSKNNRPFGVSLFFEVDGEREGWWVDKDIEDLAPVLEHTGIAKILHNAKYDINMLANLGLRFGGRIWDTMAMIHLIDEEMTCRTPDGGLKRSMALKHLAYHFLQGDAHELESLVGKVRTELAKEWGIPKSEVSYLDVNVHAPEIMTDYAIADTEFTYDLFPIFLKELKAQNLLPTYDIEINAMTAVVDMERRGILVDADKLLNDKDRLTDIMNAITIDIDNLVKTPFNVNSAEELVDTFQRLGVINWEWYTDKGELRVDEDALKVVKRMYMDSPIDKLCDYVLEHRTAQKMMSTYIDGIYDYIQYDGKVHADFWLFPGDNGKNGTKTGRLSSSNPNLQNIPKEIVSVRGEEFNIRGYFMAQEGYRLVFQDADQQEYRVLAHYANDKNFAQMIHDGWDVHKGAASLIFGVPYDEVTKELRKKTKTLNFALVYGLSNPALAVSLGHDIDEGRLRKGTKYLYKKFKVWEMPPYANKISKETMLAGVTDPDIKDGIEYFMTDTVQNGISEAVEVKKKYFAKFPDIKRFIKECSDAGRRRGFIIMWGGRIRHFHDPENQSYMAPNSLIQGSCAMIMKQKMAEVRDHLQGKLSGLVISVHDELVTEIHESELHLIHENNKILSDLPFRVPIGWGNEWGYNWGEKSDL